MPQLPIGWEETTLGEISITKQYGYTESASFEEIGPKFLRITDIQDDFVNWETVPYCPISDADYKKYKLDIGDIVIARTGNSTGATTVIKKHVDAVFASYLIRFKVDFQRADYKFIDFLLRSRLWKDFVKSIKSGSAQGGANANSFASFPIHLPPLPEQKAIAAVLSSFDDKIELLRAENQTLEQMGQELFKERFGKWKVGDDLPEGWRVGKLGEIISLQGGFVHNINLAGGEKTKIAKMGVVDGKVFFNRNSVIGYPDIIPEKYKLEEGDLIICTRDVTQDRLVIGNVALVPDDLAKFGLYAGSNTWIVKTSFHKLFLFLLFRSRNFRNHIIQSAKGSTIVMITQDAFLYTNIIIPDQETLSKFDLVIKPLLNKIRANSEQIQSLSATRDQLLPKLMSGEVRVEF